MNNGKETLPTRHHRPNYWLVFIALTVLTVLEVLIAGVPGLPLATILLTMSAAKALLVVLYFMHLRYERPLYALIFFGPLILLVVPMIVVMLV